MSNFWDKKQHPSGFASAPASINGFGRKIEDIYDAPTYGQAFNEFVNANSNVRLSHERTNTKTNNRKKTKNK
jgi:hypothetical protein